MFFKIKIPLRESIFYKICHNHHHYERIIIKKDYVAADFTLHIV